MSSPAALSPYLVLFPGNLVSNGPANAALVSLLALRWHPCLHHASGITSIALLSSPALRRHHCPRCVGIFALVALDLSPTLHPHCHKHCKLASAPSQCNCDMSAYVASSSCSLLSSVVFVAVTSAVPRQLGLHVRPISRWQFCQHCAGVLARVALVSLQASRCRLCRHCAGIVTNIALASLPSLRWHHSQHCKLASAQSRRSRNMSVCVASLSWSSSLHMASSPYLRRSTVTWPLMVRRMQRWCLCWRCAGVLGRIAPASSPTLRCCCCRRCAGIIALVAWALFPSSRWHCCPCRLRVAASIASWRLPSHEAVATRAGAIASIAPSLLPALRRHHRPHRAGVFALVALALPPSAHPRRRQHHELASAQS